MYDLEGDKQGRPGVYASAVLEVGYEQQLPVLRGHNLTVEEAA